MIFDLIVLVLIAGMTYALSSEGLWGAALMFFNVLFSSIIALNFYEPLAGVIASNVDFLSGMADALCLIVIFTVSLLLMRLATELLAPSMVRYPVALYQIGRFLFALAASALTMGMLILAFEASPVDKKVFGSVDHEAVPAYKVRLDTQILAIFQYETEEVFRRGKGRFFDPKSDWLIREFEARPYGTQKLFEDPAAAKAAAAAPAPGGK